MPVIVSPINTDKMLDTVCSVLAGGDCVAIPTETVYGLAADATNGLAVAKIFEMKGRPRFNPLICHVADQAMAHKYGVLNELAIKLCDIFWPGPLTVVVPVKPDCGIHDLVTAGLDTIGLRCPAGISREVIEHFGKPLAAPSANISGHISATTADHVATEFAPEDLMIVDDGPCAVGLESTIVRVEDEKLTLLRPGAVTVEMLSNVVKSEIGHSTVDSEIQAPGMMRSHYAPAARVELNTNVPFPECAYLAFGSDSPVHSNRRNLSDTGDLLEAAANLYHYLKILDNTGVTTICVAPIPMQGLGVAINDRLQRAAAPRDAGNREAKQCR